MLQRQESAECRAESLCELLDEQTREMRPWLGSQCWPTYDRQRQINETSRAFKDRNPSWRFVQLCVLADPERTIHWIAEESGLRVTIEHDGHRARDPWLAAQLRRIKSDIELVQARLEVRRDPRRPVRKE